LKIQVGIKPNHFIVVLKFLNGGLFILVDRSNASNRQQKLMISVFYNVDRDKLFKPHDLRIFLVTPGILAAVALREFGNAIGRYCGMLTTLSASSHL